MLILITKLTVSSNNFRRAFWTKFWCISEDVFNTYCMWSPRKTFSKAKIILLRISFIRSRQLNFSKKIIQSIFDLDIQHFIRWTFPSDHLNIWHKHLDLPDEHKTGRVWKLLRRNYFLNLFCARYHSDIFFGKLTLINLYLF